MTQGRIALWWLIFGAGLGLASGAAARGASPADDYRFANTRGFRVPVGIPPADAPRYKKLFLCASTDRGKTWKQIAVTTPDRPVFAYKAPDDGEVWFAAQGMDQQGRFFPESTAQITPNMKVIVDTRKPTLEVLRQARKGNLASISWNADDKNLDLSTLAFDFAPADAGPADSATWTPIPLPRPSGLGQESWDAGTAEPIRVRGMVADKAGNRQTVTVVLRGGLPDEALNPTVEAPGPNSPPPLGVGTFASREASRPAAGGPDGPSAEPNPGDGGNISSYNPWDDPNNLRASGPAAPGGDPLDPPIVVAKSKFSLAYAVDGAAPGGPAVVELYTTRDGGKTWDNRGPDPDRASPFDVDLGGEGRFGLKLVARSAADQGDRPPVPGEVPRSVVDVDTSGPVVTLNKPQVEGNALLVTWRSEDPHPTPAGVRSVMVSVRADTADARWQVITPQAVENTGQFRWQIPPRCPAKIHVRLDIRDDLNNLGSDETPADSPVLVDLSKPKSRIIGLDRASSRR